MGSNLRFFVLVVFGVACIHAGAATAAGFWLPNSSGGLEVTVRSMQELKYLETVRQRFDFSCGSAAVATLLTHHYGRETGEAEVFLSMWESGDHGKIRKLGFSMLDMKNFLDAEGFNADGYRIDAKQVGTIGVAGIVLLSHFERPHFVVVSGEKNGEILVNDPARGVWSLSAAELEELWNGIFFVVKGKASVAKANFNDFDVWKHRRWAPVASERLAQFTVPDPTRFLQPTEMNVNR